MLSSGKVHLKRARSKVPTPRDDPPPLIIPHALLRRQITAPNTHENLQASIETASKQTSLTTGVRNTTRGPYTVYSRLVSRTPGDLIQYTLVSRTPGDLIQYTLVSRIPGDFIQYTLVSRTPGDLIQYNLVSRTPGDLIQYNLVSRTPGDLIQYNLVSRTPGDLIQYTLVSRTPGDLIT